MAFLRVSKCCCCCSLKYGFLTFSIISLLYRLCGAISLAYLGSTTMSISSSDANDPFSINPATVLHSASEKRVEASSNKMSVVTGIGSFVGWYFVTAAILVVAINGIFQKRSIYLYPYIIVLIVELIVAVVTSIIMAIAVSPIVLINLVIIGAINVYSLICLISLFRTFKEYERSRPTITYESVQLKTV